MRENERRSRRFAKKLRRQMPDAEIILWSRLRRHPVHKVRRQHPVGPYVTDFACVAKRVIIEIDGATHSTREEQRLDRVREAFLKSDGWKIIRVWNEDVYRGLDGVLDLIEAELKRI